MDSNFINIYKYQIHVLIYHKYFKISITHIFDVIKDMFDFIVSIHAENSLATNIQ